MCISTFTAVDYLNTSSSAADCSCGRIESQCDDEGGSGCRMLQKINVSDCHTNQVISSDFTVKSRGGLNVTTNKTQRKLSSL